MKKILLALNLLYISDSFSQSNNDRTCGTAEMTDYYYQSNPKARVDHDNFELYTAEFIKQQNASKSSNTACYVIPVVFHVYGNIQGGKHVNDTVIQRAISILNKDFHGLNPDFNTVHTSFLGIRGTMPDITFALAQLDPDGNPTTGIEYYPTRSGYANSMNWPLVAAEAWDNYKYMNIYVQNDLGGTGNYTWGGFSTFPDTAKSNAKLTMIGLNGIYMGYNSGEEKAGINTHEVGHWLNLYHTFQGGCAIPGDYVADTPECNYLGGSYGCHSSPTSTLPINCNNSLINAENYMDYSSNSGCFKMFTQGQMNRAYAALNHPTRFPLWQPLNLVATGLAHLCPGIGTGIANSTSLSQQISLYPNPNNGSFVLDITEAFTGGEFVLMNLIGQVIYKQQLEPGKNNIVSQGFSSGLYYYTIYQGKRQIVNSKLIIK